MSEAAPPKPTSVKVTIDGTEVSVAPGSTIIQAADQVGTYIPHFCYHAGLSVVGQCRMCFVEIEGAPKLATACSQPVAEGMKINTKSEKVKAGQNATLEFTLLNHPLDCPICDRGGECKLQDYTYEYGPPRSRMIDDKMFKDKHRAISEQVVLDQERCILCTRCVRFSAEVDGREELVVENRASHNVVDVFEGNLLQSKFTGNVVDLCPVGALTAKDFRFQARPWELRRHEAVCTGCAVGCNIEIHTKNRHPGIPRPNKLPPKPEIERLVPRENLDVNTWWLCDKGRWGYHFHNELEKHLLEPTIKRTPESQSETVSLREVQLFMEASAKLAGEWEFWVSDSVPMEGITWAKELASSWKARGRKVNGQLNPSAFGSKLLNFWNQHFTGGWSQNPADWKGVTEIYSVLDYRELEDIVPVLSLRLGQDIRKGKTKFSKVSFAEMAALAGKADPTKTAFLVFPPQQEGEFEGLKKFPKDAKILPLWSQTNSRGLLAEGIAPIDTLVESLKGQTPRGPVFFVNQKTQNLLPPELEAYLARAPFLVVADSFASSLVARANIVLPLTPLYESAATLMNLEGRKQMSAGILIDHPNYPSLHRGGPIVAASLRLL